MPSPKYQLQQNTCHQYRTNAESKILAATKYMPSVPHQCRVQNTSCNKIHAISTAPMPSPKYQLQQNTCHQYRTNAESKILAATKYMPSVPHQCRVQNTSCNKRVCHQYRTNAESKIPAATKYMPSVPHQCRVQNTSCNKIHAISTAPMPSPKYQLQQNTCHQYRTNAESKIPAATKYMPSVPHQCRVQNTSCNKIHAISTAPMPSPKY